MYLYIFVIFYFTIINFIGTLVYCIFIDSETNTYNNTLHANTTISPTTDDCHVSFVTLLSKRGCS